MKEILLQHFPQLALPSVLLLPLSLISPLPLSVLMIQLRSYLLLFQQAPCYCPGCNKYLRLETLIEGVNCTSGAPEQLCWRMAALKPFSLSSCSLVSAQPLSSHCHPPP